MLTAGQSSTVAFAVNVMGTSADPSVRVILAAHPELSFPATKDGDKWSTHLAIPATLAPGSYDLRVEVTLNGRLFTPIRKKVEVHAAEQTVEPTPAKVEPKIEAKATVAPNPVVAKTAPQVIAPKNSLFAQVTQAKQYPTAPSVSYPKLKSFESIGNDTIAVEPIEATEPAELTGLASIVSRGPRKIYSVHTPLPRKSQVTEAPITVRISEIDSITSKTSVRVIESAPIIRAQKPIHNTTLVKLVKEDVFYE